MNVTYWLVGVVALVLVAFLHHYRRRQRLGLPGPFGLPIVGSAFEVAGNRLRAYDYITDGVNKYGPTWGLLMGPRDLVFVLEPESVDHFLKKNFKNYEKGPNRRDEFQELLGDGIFVANGAEWKMHRNLAKPLFRTSSIDQGMVPIFAAHTDEILTELAEAAHKKEPIELTKVFMQYTMTTFLSLGLGCTDSMLTKKEKLDFAAAFDQVQAESNTRGYNPLWRFFITKQFKENVKHVDSVVYRIIAERKKEDEETLRSKSDIFSQFLLVHDEEGKPLTDKYLRDVFMNFLLAGRDTTAALLTWTFFELDRHPHIKDKVLEEIDRVVKGDIPTADEIHELEYTKRVLTEVLRLHPSVPVDAREAVADDTLPSGHPVHKGATVIYSPYVMGRSEKLFPDPLKIDPDRWSDVNIKGIKPGQFAAFHWGPQTCLGKEMAYVEARVALVAVLKKFDLILADDPQKCYQTTIILLPKDGLMMQPVFRK